MKRITAVIIFAAILISLLAVSSFASFEVPEEELPYMPTIPNDKINYGTPKIDGVVDDIYANTFQCTSSTVANWDNGNGVVSDSDAQGTTYILWDEYWVYFCTEVYDSTILSQGEDWIFNGTHWGGPWMNDAVQIFLAWHGEDDDATTYQKWGMDAYGILLYTVNDSLYYEGYEEAYAVAKMDKKNRKYVIEMAIPNAEGLTEGDFLGFCQQINDIVDFAGTNEQDGCARCACYFGYQQPWLFPYELVDDGSNPHVYETGDAPTEDPTQAPTDAPTQTPTEEPTQAPTEEPTQAPTDAPTQAPTEEPTQAPTDAPTQTPTEGPTQAPTDEPTQTPTVEPTQAPTGEEPTADPSGEPTEEPTQEPTNAPTDAPTNPPTAAPTQPSTQEATESPAKKGCGSAVISGAAVVMLACAAAVVLKKKD